MCRVYKKYKTLLRSLLTKNTKKKWGAKSIYCIYLFLILLKANSDFFTITHTSQGNDRCITIKKWTPLSLRNAKDQPLFAAATSLCCHFKDIHYDLHNLYDFVCKYVIYTHTHTYTCSHTQLYLESNICLTSISLRKYFGVSVQNQRVLSYRIYE